MSREWQQGAAKLKTIIWLLVLGGAFYVGAKVAPAYVTDYQLADKMYEEARFAQANRRSADQLRDIIYREAQTLDLPVRPEDIHVELNPQGVRISANYTVTVNLHVYQFKLYLTPTSGWQ